MIPHNDYGSTRTLPKTCKEQASTYGRAADFLLKSYTTDSNIAMATSAIACLKKSLLETLEQFADVLQSKVVHFVNAYQDECTKEVFSDCLSASIHKAIKMF